MFRSYKKSFKKLNIKLLIAIEKNKIEKVTKYLQKKYLQKGVDVNFNDGCGSSPLRIAVKRSSLEIIQLLLNAGANVNAEYNDNRSDETALTEAAWRGDIKIIQLLLQAGANVNAIGQNAVTQLHFCAGYTALMIAIQRGNTEIVKLLLQANADVDAADKYGVTALMIATMKGDIEIVKLLLRANADVNAKSKVVAKSWYGGKSGTWLSAGEGYATTALMMAELSTVPQEIAPLLLKARINQIAQPAGLPCSTFQQGAKDKDCVMSKLPSTMLKEIYSYVLPSSLLNNGMTAKREILFQNIFDAGNRSLTFFNRRVRANEEFNQGHLLDTSNCDPTTALQPKKI